MPHLRTGSFVVHFLRLSCVGFVLHVVSLCPACVCFAVRFGVVYVVSVYCQSWHLHWWCTATAVQLLDHRGEWIAFFFMALWYYVMVWYGVPV